MFGEEVVDSYLILSVQVVGVSHCPLQVHRILVHHLSEVKGEKEAHESNTVYSIHHTSMSWDQVTEIFDFVGSFESTSNEATNWSHEGSQSPDNYDMHTVVRELVPSFLSYNSHIECAYTTHVSWRLTWFKHKWL